MAPCATLLIGPEVVVICQFSFRMANLLHFLWVQRWWPKGVATTSCQLVPFSVGQNMMTISSGQFVWLPRFLLALLTPFFANIKIFDVSWILLLVEWNLKHLFFSKFWFLSISSTLFFIFLLFPLPSCLTFLFSLFHRNILSFYLKLGKTVLQISLFTSNCVIMSVSYIISKVL